MNHIFLTGFMGAGKSAVGRRVATALGRPFFDLDREIERREEASIPEIFRARGEEGFRDSEHRALESLVETGPSVIATGGGAVVRADNQALLKRHGTVVYLAVSPEQAMARLGNHTDRPLLARGGIDTARRILEARLPVYAATADRVVPTDGRTEAEVTEAVLAALGVGSSDETTTRIRVSEGGGDYEILVGPGLIGRAGALIRPAIGEGAVALVSDETVWPLVGECFAGALRGAGLRVSTHVIEAGEVSKSWQRAGSLLEEFAAEGLDRGSAVVAIGGGVVGDLAGFCAATYMRGIALVHVPTTLLAQVDSAIGGKTGVDLTSGKNLAGAFWPPRLVLSDTDVLATLPEIEWTNGLVELVKGAYLEGGPTLDRVEAGLDRLTARDQAAVVRAVGDAASFKARVVSADLREADLRESLNFGHTLGHALELLVGYGVLPHGLAVAEGMRFAARLAEAVVGAPGSLTERVSATLEMIGAGEQPCRRAIAPALSRVRPAAVLDAMKADKKSRGGSVRFVLLSEAGRWQSLTVADDVLLEHLGRWHDTFE